MENWLQLGLDNLAETGPRALTIDELCLAAGKTRGSFYFHFSTIGDFHIALAQAWFDRHVEELIATVGTSPGNRLDLLNRLAGRLDLKLETGIRKLALLDGDVERIVRKGDTARVAWLASLYQKTGTYTNAQADRLAAIEYAAFTGFRLINPDMQPAEARAFYEGFLELTGRPAT